MLTGQEHQYRLREVKRLRKKGLGNKEIAEKIDLPIHTVQNVACQLIKEGKIGRLSPGSKPGFIRDDTSWRDINNERTKTIIAMVKQRATLQEVANAIGVSARERASQLVEKIAKVHGSKVFKPDEKLWTLQEASHKLDMWHSTIYKICTAGEIPCRKHGTHYVIDAEGMKALKKHPLVTKKRVCTVCGTVFAYKHGQTKMKFCSEKCFKEEVKRCRLRFLSKKPTLESFTGWIKNLWRKLRHYRIPRDEEWLTLEQATLRSGLSKTQIWWLRMRKVITHRCEPGKVHGKYASSEMEIAKQVHTAYAQRNGKTH